MPISAPRWISHLITGTLVICAVTLTTITVRHELSRNSTASTRQRGIAYTPQHVVNPPDASVGHRTGPVRAPVTFVEFSDFQCPYCAALSNTLRELRDRYPDKVAIVYRHYPSPAHAYAMPAAIAAECAADQGRFEQFAALMFRGQDSLGVTPWTTFATRAGVRDLAAFERCRQSPAVAARITADQTAGARLGIAGTPALILNGEMLVGAIPIDQLEAWIQSAGYTVASR